MFIRSWKVSRSDVISRSLFCPENWLHAWTWLTTMVGWQIKGNVWVLDQLEHSLFQWFHTLKSLYFKDYFSFTWHLEFPYTDLLQFKHKCTHLFATNVTSKQYTRQEQSLKDNIYSKSTKALNLSLLNTTTYMAKAPSILFPNPPLLKIFIWKYCPNEIQDKHTKKSQEKTISSKQHCISFISDTFVSNTGWDLIKNNDKLRYHNVHKKNQCNCFEPPACKSQKYWLGYQKIQQILGSDEFKVNLTKNHWSNF